MSTAPLGGEFELSPDRQEIRKLRGDLQDLQGTLASRDEALAELRRKIDGAVNLVRSLNEVLNPVQEAWRVRPKAGEPETRFGPALAVVTFVDWSRAPADVRAWQQVIRALEALQPGTIEHEILDCEDRKFK